MPTPFVVTGKATHCVNVCLLGYTGSRLCPITSAMVESRENCTVRKGNAVNLTGKD